MRTGQLLQGSNRFLDLNLNTFCYFFLSSTKEKSMSGESTCNEQLFHSSACVCRDIEHAQSLESTKEAKELHSAAPGATLAS